MDLKHDSKNDEVFCPLCRNLILSSIFKPKSSYDIKKKYSISECSNCHVAHTLPLPTHSELTDIYTKSYAYDIHSLIFQEKK